MTPSTQLAPALHLREPALIWRAGHKARALLQERGLRAEDVALLPGAAGGPKGIGLLGLDKAIFGEFLSQAKRPRTLIGASVGSWRFAAVAGGKTPAQIVSNLERLAASYTHQRIPKGVTLAQMSQLCDAFLDEVLGDTDAHILNNPDYRLVVVADRCRHLFASDAAALLFPALIGVIGANLISRRALGAFMQRYLFCVGAAALPLTTDAFPTHRVALTAANLRASLMASAAIPAVIGGVKNIPGASVGTYRDGGLLDYHLDLPYQTDELVLYPHFAERVTPGWFDKPLKWRNASPANMASTLLVAPSADFLAHLPHGKLPSRDDFKRYAGDDAGREAYWKKALIESERMGDEFLEAVATGRIVEQLTAF